jgi:predicted PurR-regulated permease PerM
MARSRDPGKVERVSNDQNTETRLASLLFYAAVLLLAWLVYRIFEPFLAPLAWAAVLVVFCAPVHRRLATRLGEMTAAALSTLAVALIIIAPTLWILYTFVRQGFTAAQSVQQQFAGGGLHWANNAWAWFQARYALNSPPDFEGMVREQGSRMAELLAGRLGPILRNFALFFFDVFVTMLAMFYLFRDGETILLHFRRALPFEPQFRDRMVDGARELIFATVISSLVAGAVHGVAGATAFALAGIQAPVFWGVAIAFCSLLPVVGSALIWVPTAAILVARGDLRHAALISFMLIFAGMIVDYFLRPWIIGGRAELSGLVVFISVLGGISVFGTLGVVLGPIVVAAAASVLDVYQMREQQPLGPVECADGNVIV